MKQGTGLIQITDKRRKHRVSLVIGYEKDIQAGNRDRCSAGHCGEQSGQGRPGGPAYRQKK